MTEKQNVNRIFSITIDINYKLICSLIKSDTKEENVIQLKENQEEYIPRISFNGSKIIICKETEDSIHFIKELLEEPEDFKFYSIRYNNKEYQVIGEVLFALIINEFKEIVEKEFILTNI